MAAISLWTAYAANHFSPTRARAPWRNDRVKLLHPRYVGCASNTKARTLQIAYSSVVLMADLNLQTYTKRIVLLKHRKI